MIQRYKYGIGVLVAAVVALSVIFVWPSLRGQEAKAPAPVIPASGVLLSPIHADTAGMDPNSGFRLTSAVSLSRDLVERTLTLQPAVNVRVEQEDREGRIFRVQPVRALESDRVYRVQLAATEGVDRPYQWSFQTKAEFRVLGSLPRHQGTGVPPDTGIEIAFTHEDFGDVEPFFTITPQVDGRFERHKQTVAFVPKEKLVPGTVYTVTLKPGLSRIDSDDVLAEEFRFSFEVDPFADEKNQRVFQFDVPRDLLEFPEGEAPFFQVYYWGEQRKEGVQTGSVAAAVTVHRYRDGEHFIDALQQLDQVPWWADFANRTYTEKSNRLSRAVQFETELKQLPGHGSPYLMFPEALPPGYYLTEVSIEDQVRQVRFQVSDLASYVSVSSTQSLVWVNDVSSGNPVSNADVAHPTGRVETGADGLAVFPTPVGFGESESEGLILHVKAGAKEAVVSVSPGGFFIPYGGDMPAAREMAPGKGMTEPWWPGYQQSATDYWRYLYTDRPLYQPDDTLHLFGVVRPRTAGAAVPEQVTVRVTRQQRWGWGWEYGFGQQPMPLATTSLTVAANTFTGSVALPNLTPGSYQLEVRMGDEHLVSRWFEVQSYTKPAYRIEVTPDRQAMFIEDTASFRLESLFFEGTPLPELPLQYRFGWGDHIERQVVTDANGVAVIPFSPSDQDPFERNEHWGGSAHVYLNAWAILPEAGEISGGAPLQVFPRNVTLKPTVEVENGSAVITVQVNHITLEQINAVEGWDYTGAPAAGLQVETVLTEDNYVRVETGDYYDFIQKKVVKSYRYDYAPREVGRFTGTTDGVGQFVQRVTVNPEKSYRIRIQAQDTKDRQVIGEAGFSGRQYKHTPQGSFGYRYHQITPVDPEKQVWTIGEEVLLQMRENEAPMADRDDSFLFYQARLGLQAHVVQDTAAYSFSFREADVPNTNVRAVYFDGRSYQTAGEYQVRFDPDQRKLQVSITPDHADYRPGEEANFTIRVTDGDGRPVVARVNLNLVDEALYALRDQTADLLTALYGEMIPSGILQTRQSNMREGMDQSTRSMAAEAAAPPGMGGAVPAPSQKSVADSDGRSGSEVRTDFRDTAYFTTVATDSDGQGKVSLRLPDNLTTWRLTYQAFVPGDVSAAAGTAPVVVKIPFFVDMVLGETYLSGDQPVLTVRSYGAELAAEAPVAYAVTLIGPDGSSSYSASGSAFAPVMIPLEELKDGTYTVRVKGTSGSLVDELEKQVQVLQTYLRQRQVNFSLLQSGARITGARSGLTSLTFTDHQRGSYVRLLEQMRWSGGSRFEQKLAQSVANELLTSHFGYEGLSDEADWQPQGYQVPDGSIAILPYSDGDLYLSALTADLAPDRFDQGALIGYFHQVLADEGSGRERQIIALYGLAALDRPVLQEIRKLMTVSDLSLSEQLYLGLAATSLGDLEGVRPIYRSILEDKGETLGSATRIQVGRDQDEILTATALTAVLGARLAEPEATTLVAYLLENPTKEVLLLLEQLLATKAILPGIDTGPVSFTYVLDGQEKQVELKPGETVRWTLAPNGLDGLQIKGVQGQVGVTVAYDAPLGLSENWQEPGYTLERVYTVAGQGEANRFKPGDLVKVTLTVRLPDTVPGGGFEVTDYLPSGLKLVQRPWQHGISYTRSNDPAWPLTVQGQRVTFWAHPEMDPITYYARVVSPGSFTAEQPVLQHQKSGVIYAMGQRERVQINR